MRGGEPSSVADGAAGAIIGAAVNAVAAAVAAGALAVVASSAELIVVPAAAVGAAQLRSSSCIMLEGRACYAWSTVALLPLQGMLQRWRSSGRRCQWAAVTA